MAYLRNLEGEPGSESVAEGILLYPAVSRSGSTPTSRTNQKGPDHLQDRAGS